MKLLSGRMSATRRDNQTTSVTRPALLSGAGGPAPNQRAATPRRGALAAPPTACLRTVTCAGCGFASQTTCSEPSAPPLAQQCRTAAAAPSAPPLALPPPRTARGCGDFWQRRFRCIAALLQPYLPLLLWRCSTAAAALPLPLLPPPPQRRRAAEPPSRRAAAPPTIERRVHGPDTVSCRGRRSFGSENRVLPLGFVALTLILNSKGEQAAWQGPPGEFPPVETQKLSKNTV